MSGAKVIPINRVDRIEGWWPPPGEGPHTLKGILVNFVDKNMSAGGLLFNVLVFELVEPCDECMYGGSKGDDELHTGPIGCLIGIPEWKPLEELWPTQRDRLVHVTHSETSLGRGRRMHSVQAKVQK